MIENETEEAFHARMAKLCTSDMLTKGKYILDNDDNVVPVTDLRVWGEWMESPASYLKRVLCRTYITPDIFVSTVFLGMDHAWNISEDEKYMPLIWETMVFHNHSGGEQERYHTREQAIEGHLRMLDEARTLLSVANLGEE